MNKKKPISTPPNEETEMGMGERILLAEIALQ